MPRRRAQKAVDKAAGVSENMRFRDRDGVGLLTSKNEMDNPLLKEFSPTGILEAWTLDRPAEEVGWSVYGGLYDASGKSPTKQASYASAIPFHDQNKPIVVGDPPPDPAHSSAVGAFAHPPIVELVATAVTGYAEGWWALGFCFQTASGMLTELGPIAVFFLASGEGVQFNMPADVPAGITGLVAGMLGPFPTQEGALAVQYLYAQNVWSTYPRLPGIGKLVGSYATWWPLSFYINSTYLPTPPADATDTSGNTSGDTTGDTNAGETTGVIVDTAGNTQTRRKRKRR